MCLGFISYIVYMVYMTSHINNSYEEQLRDNNRRFFIILEEIKRTYPLAMLYTDSDNYQTNYSRAESNMQSLNKDFFMLYNKIDTELKQQSKVIKTTDDELDLIKEKNSRLLRLYNKLKNSNGGAKELASQTIDQYNIRFIKLIDLIIGILLLSIIMYKV
jgi:hypothetical protein